jgi:perosamine synthetase
MATLALNGGRPIRAHLLPYARQSIDERDLAAVAEVLRSDWLTTGPQVVRFEQQFAAGVDAREAVTFSSGTAALHGTVFALGLGPGDEVIVPALTFAASANAVRFQGATPVFADVDPDTLLLDPRQVEAGLSERTRAVMAVDYAGQPCDYGALRALTEPRGIPVVADACHALGATWLGRKVGSLARMSAFSLHPAKHITTGEGGVVTTDDAELAARLRRFRNHGIATDLRQRERLGTWRYDMVDLGYNYRLSDFQCALGCSQLQKLPAWVERRRAIARRYDAAFAARPTVEPLRVRPDVGHAYHLYVVRLELDRLACDRATVYGALRAENIGVNVHYLPVPWHSYYQRLGYGKGRWPVAEGAYERILTLPLFPAMTDGDVEDVIAAVAKVTGYYAR